jgi:RNA polymerase sigma-70 factor (ECF subfamily)
MERPLDPARLGDHLDRLYRAAWALCGTPEDAEDLVQETFARVLGRRRLLRSEDDLGYLLRTLRNTFLTQKRTEGRRLRPGPLPDQLELVADPHAREPQAALEAGEVYAAIAALPGDFRDVLVAVDVTGLSYKEAARVLGIQEGTVMSRLTPSPFPLRSDASGRRPARDACAAPPWRVSGYITPGSERAVRMRPRVVMITALATGSTCTMRP